MRLFADANVLVAVLNKEYPIFSYAARVLGVAGKEGFEVYTSPVCLAIARTERYVRAWDLGVRETFRSGLMINIEENACNVQWCIFQIINNNKAK